nr:immunoglobulin heavy chain junction region [Homo sapiens]
PIHHLQRQRQEV